MNQSNHTTERLIHCVWYGLDTCWNNICKQCSIAGI